MLGLPLTTFLPSLLSVVSSSSEYSKSDEGWYPSSSLEIFATRSERDRRTTHRELRSHSNLDDDRRRVDDDRDRGYGQISYPLLVDQQFPLGFPASRGQLSGESSNEIDFSEEEASIMIEGSITASP